MIRSIQTLIPFTLATLGWFLSFVVGNMPWLEWHISEVVTDLPAAFEVHVSPSPWTLSLGDTLTNSVNNSRRIWVNGNAQLCFVATRSQSDQMLERVLNIKPIVLAILYVVGLIEVVLSFLYIWFFTIWNESLLGCLYSVFSTFFGGIIFVSIFEVTRLFGNTPHLSMFDVVPTDCYGTVTFNAELLRVHYETPLMLFVVIGLELGALAIVFYQMRKSINDKKESSKLAVG